MASLLTLTTFAAGPAGVMAAKDETYRANQQLSRNFTSESLVLLKNEASALPLTASDSVAVFGSTQINTFKTVFGSGSTEGIGIGFIDTMSVLKTKVKTDAALEQMYRNFAAANPPDYGQTYIDNEILSARSIPEMTLTDEVVSAAAERNNKAVIFIGRTTGEGYDWQLKDEYELRAVEKDMIDTVTKYFDRVTVVLNTANPIDMTWDSDAIDAILWAGIPGNEGAAAISAVLTGEVNPSGKLTMTWPEKYTDTPTHMNYEMTHTPEGLHGPEVVYEEDIFVGYKYYDSFNITPKFHFGYGLSYTTFDTTVDSVTVEDETVTIKATVENTGRVAGKETLQVYTSAQQSTLRKAYQELAAFAKTDLLSPGEKQTLAMTYSLRDMASYDEEKAQYVLARGEYIVRVGNSSRSTHVAAVLELDGTAVTEQLSNRMVQATDIDRFDSTGVTPYSYDGEADEIQKADRIKVSAKNIKTLQSANTITDQPELLEGSVETAFAEAAGQALQRNGYAVAAVAEDSDVFTLPATVHCADLGTNFAGFVVNDPSGDKDGYKSVTVQKAGTEMPFTVSPTYGGSHTVTLRYFVESASTVILKDQNDKTLATFALSTLGAWADAKVTGVDLTGVTKLVIRTENDDIELNTLKVESEEYAGVVDASLPAGSYPQAIRVTLRNADYPDAKIHYTTDGSDPDASDPLYTAPIAVDGDTVIKAITVKAGLKDSAVATYAYTIDSTITGTAVQPTYHFVSRDVDGDQVVALRAGSGMRIFYTLDGSTPDSTATLYTAPITVRQGAVIKAVAMGPGVKTSAVTTIRLALIAAPTADVETGGTYLTGQVLNLTAAAGTTIYYTMTADGSEPADPTENSAKYADPLTLNDPGRIRIKAIAVNTTGGLSEVAEFAYQITDKLYTLEDVYLGDATVEQVVAQMNLSELCEVVASAGRSTRFGSPSVSYADGPLGVKAGNFTKWAAPSLLACAWDVELFAAQGDAIGQEMLDEGIDFWLAPGVNILRDPRSGRNPEYYAEDETLTGVLASAVINGVQAHGVGCVVKHYVGNDQETHRKQCANAVVSERAMREIYLKAFEIVVKTSQPWGLMTTYCDVNRMSTATNFDLCTAIPRGEWGYENMIFTDWGCYADNGMMMYAGNDLIMPSGNAEQIKNSVLNPETVNTADPNYTKPTTKAMLQRNVVNIFKVMVQTPAFLKRMDIHEIFSAQSTSIKATEHRATSPGIGTEGCQDEGGGMNPTYTDGGTWLEYRIHVKHSSWFDLSPRVSVNTAGAGFNLLIDGEPAAAFTDLAATGGWQNWVTLPAQQIYLEAGAHTLRVEFAASGMNVNWYRFDPIVSIASVEQIADKTVAMGTTYSALDLPDSLKATLTTGEAISVPVRWDFRAYQPNEAGTYTLTGTIMEMQDFDNRNGIIPTVTVTVLEKGGLPGDVDLSGNVDVADIMKLKALIMADKWSETEQHIGDLDNSGQLDVGDIMAVKNIIMSK